MANKAQYVIVRRQYIDPFDHSQGFYDNEFNLNFAKELYSRKEILKEIFRLQCEEGKHAKYRFGYIKLSDLDEIWRSDQVVERLVRAHT